VLFAFEERSIARIAGSKARMLLRSQLEVKGEAVVISRYVKAVSSEEEGLLRFVRRRKERGLHQERGDASYGENMLSRRKKVGFLH